MDTNLKSTKPATNTFAGLLSWLCMLSILCAACVTAVFAIMVLVNPSILQCAANSVHEFAGSVPPALEYLDGDKTAIVQAGDDIIYQYTVKITSAAAIIITALIITFAFRRDRRAFEAIIARSLGRVWVEIKLLFLMPLVIFGLTLLDYGSTELYFVFCILMVLAVYFICLDIGRNHRFFGHNIIHSIIIRLNDFHQMTTFQQRALRRVYSAIIIVISLLLLGIFGFMFLRDLLWLRRELVLAIPFTCFIGIIGTVWWYILSLKRDLQDWNLLMDQITEMYGGDLNAVNHVPPTSNLYDCAMQLNMIRTGVQKAVEEATKADRTKIELITNVSHDIKTPLTSVISYVELLKKEPDLPETAKDYVNILSQKAQRLNAIVADVFEVSKAATGNISLNLEDLDIGRLMRQTLVEMEETVERSGLQWRVDIPEQPLMVHADGQRMYRVFQNLIRNCTQYSLPGSRVYVSILAQGGMACANIRNTSKSEITMSSEDLTARFVRGDQNRTTEGSGLGLSIAKSFTEACGGHFFLRTDEDLFMVTVQFPLVTPGMFKYPPAPEEAAGPAPTAPADLQSPVETEGQAPAESPGAH